MKRIILFPLSIIYSFVMSLRNMLYDSKFLKVRNFDKPIVSVGNLTMGGTGKTPIICELIAWALSAGLRPAVVSRGYKSKIKNVTKVPPGGSSAIYGDEPAMVVKKFTQVPFYIGGDRIAVVEELLKHEAVDIIFADDAFQHRRLGRNLDILIIDCTENINNYQVLPGGRGREDKAGLRRADFIILNKVNLINPDKKQEVIDFIAQVSGDKIIPIIESEYYVRQFINLAGDKREDLKSNEKVLLFSGLGNPSAFEYLMNLNLNICEHIKFRDHHNYTNRDLEKILELGRKLQVQRIVTTEKDAVKISQLKDSGDKIWIAELVPKMSIRVKNLHEKIVALCN